jgi:TolA-binding protein
MTTRRHTFWFAAGAVGLLATSLLAQSTASATEEDVARRQLENGRANARRGNYKEALVDFKNVAETYARTSLADNALLEIARYYLDVAGDQKLAATAVDDIIKKYPLSDSAPDAYVMAGRIALAHSHQQADLDTALASFDRVSTLFPTAEAVPRALRMAGDTLWFAGRLDEALANLGRVDLEYPTSPAAAEAHLSAGRVLLSLGDPISAMDELQQVRNRWPNTPEAALALSRISLLHRLYVRSMTGPAWVVATDPVGPPKLESVVGLAVVGGARLYWATESGVGAVTSTSGEIMPTVAKPRSLFLDTLGNLIVADSGVLRPMTGQPMLLMLPRSDGTQEALSKPDGVVQLSNSEYLVMDGNGKNIQRYDRAGTYKGPFAASKADHLAINAVDEVAALDRDQKGVVLYDGQGKTVGKIPFKAAGYDLQNPQDLAYDAFGHLYVLDRGAIAVFSPYPAAPAAAAPGAAPAPAAGAPRLVNYRLVTLFAEPEKSLAGFHKALAFAVDQSGVVYVADDSVKRILVYR